MSRSREEIETELQKAFTRGAIGPNAGWALAHVLYDEIRDKAVEDHILAQERSCPFPRLEGIEHHAGADLGPVRAATIAPNGGCASGGSNLLRVIIDGPSWDMVEKCFPEKIAQFTRDAIDARRYRTLRKLRRGQEGETIAVVSLPDGTILTDDDADKEVDALKNAEEIEGL